MNQAHISGDWRYELRERWDELFPEFHPLLIVYAIPIVGGVIAVLLLPVLH